MQEDKLKILIENKMYEVLELIKFLKILKKMTTTFDCNDISIVVSTLKESVNEIRILRQKRLLKMKIEDHINNCLKKKIEQRNEILSNQKILNYIPHLEDKFVLKQIHLKNKLEKIEHLLNKIT